MFFIVLRRDIPRTTAATYREAIELVVELELDNNKNILNVVTNQYNNLAKLCSAVDNSIRDTHKSISFAVEGATLRSTLSSIPLFRHLEDADRFLETNSSILLNNGYYSAFIMRVGVKDPIRRSIVLSELSPPAAHAEVFNSACRLAANMKSSVAANRPVEAYVELEDATSAIVHIAPKEERHLTVLIMCSEDNPYTLSAELVTTEGITKTKNTFNISTPSEYQALLQEMRRFLS